MTDTDHASTNGLEQVHKALLADVATLQGLLSQLQTFVLFCSLNPARPMPPLVLEDCADRLERLLAMVRGQMSVE